MRKFIIIITVLIFASCSQKKLFRYNTDKISKFIAANTLYPEDAVSQNLSALIIIKISFKKNGDIDSISSLQSSQSEFSKAVIFALEKGNKTLFNGINKIPLLIPIYFLHADENTILKIDYEKDFSPVKMEQYPFKCTYFKPIIIVSRSNKRTR